MPVRQPTTATPDELPTYRAGMAQVVHSPASDERGTLMDPSDWPPVAQAVVAMGGRWPAAVRLAGTEATDAGPPLCTHVYSGAP